VTRSAHHRGTTTSIVVPRAGHLACALVLCVAGAAHAGEPVFKCSTPDGIVYQGVPCGGVSMDVRIAPPPAVAAGASAGPRAGQPAACGARSSPAGRGLWRRGALCLGITDDEVLNLPAWGKPAAIERVRVREGWREAWRYAFASGRSTRLSFLNGRLETVDDGSADALDGAAVRVSAVSVR